MLIKSLATVVCVVISTAPFLARELLAPAVHVDVQSPRFQIATDNGDALVPTQSHRALAIGLTDVDFRTKSRAKLSQADQDRAPETSSRDTQAVFADLLNAVDDSVAFANYAPQEVNAEQPNAEQLNASYLARRDSNTADSFPTIKLLDYGGDERLKSRAYTRPLRGAPDKKAVPQRSVSAGATAGSVGMPAVVSSGSSVSYSPGSSTRVASSTQATASTTQSISQLLEFSTASSTLALVTPNSVDALQSDASDDGRPKLTADGKFGIPNHQYWTFDFMDHNSDGSVDKLDADIQFSSYLDQLNILLENANQVVKFSPSELSTHYNELNSQIPQTSPAKSPSYLTFMIIDFPLKGFYLPQSQIPETPGLPPGAVN